MKSMRPTWQPDGFFELSDSDNHAGSLYSIEDMMTILSIPSTNKDFFIKQLQRRRLLNDANRIKEPRLFDKTNHNGKKVRKWVILMDSLSSVKPQKDQTLSELELKAIINKVYEADVKIKTQIDIGNYAVDIVATYKNDDYYIDFLGPWHFYSDENIDKDNERKKQLKAKGIRLIEWPYWIQFCKNNVRIAFGEKLEGKGAIWGSSVFWQGVSDKVKQRIISLSQSFNAIHDDGIGYFYELWEENGNVIKPAHPIIEMIKNGKYTIDKLLPANLDVEEKKFWLPKELWKLINQE